MPRKIPLAQYIFTRLRQLNCHSIHGVPGDYFLRALDHTRAARVNWIGNANELCAGYAADGYARAGMHAAARRVGTGPKLGAFLTTYGVGELSAINAMAGSMAEHTPVLHLVGTPSTRALRAASSTRPVHHSLGNGKMGVYAEMAKLVTCGQVQFDMFARVGEAVEAFDEMLMTCVRRSQPVYATVPSDWWEVEVPAELLETTLDVDMPMNEKAEEEVVVGRIVHKLLEAKRPLLVADGPSYPFDFIKEANQLVDLLRMPAMSLTAGKGVIEEDSPYWHGPLTPASDYASSADLVLYLGPLLSDVNTGAWSAVPPCTDNIFFNLDTVSLDDRLYSLRSKPILNKLLIELSRGGNYIRATSPTLRPATQRASSISSPSDPITHDALWPRLTSFLQPNDTLLLANGTPLIGASDMTLTRTTQIIASSLWTSIGQMLPCAQGVSLAKRDTRLPGRTILFEGDGSFQVTCQSLSDMIRYRIPATIFICNNAGYTYERWLHGMREEYNDVPSWRYVDLPRVFGAEEGNSADYPVCTKRIQRWDELESVLADESFGGETGLQIIDVMMGREDVPEKSKRGLLKAAEALKIANGLDNLTDRSCNSKS